MSAAVEDLSVLARKVARTADSGKVMVVAYDRGPFVVTWRHQRRRRTVEGSTLAVALRRAAKAATSTDGAA